MKSCTSMLVAVSTFIIVIQIVIANDDKNYNNYLEKKYQTRQCNYQLLSRELSKKVKNILDESHNSYGCHGYSSMDCKTMSTSFQCKLSKKLEIQNGSPCQEHLLQKGLTHKITKILRKSKSKFNCNDVKSVSCEMKLDGRTNCNVLNNNNDQPIHEMDNTLWNKCNLALLEQDLVNEIRGTLTKSQIRFRCPKADYVSCRREKNMYEMNCEVFIPFELDIPSTTCNMNYVTQSLSEDIGESFVRSEMKYGCKVPETLHCKIVGKEFPDYIDCNILTTQEEEKDPQQRQETASDDDDILKTNANKKTYGNANGKKSDGHNQRQKKEKDVNEKQQKKEMKKAKDTSATSSTTASIPTINGDDEQNKMYKKFFAKYNLRGKKSEM